MTKRLLILVLAAAFAVTVPGCGDANDSAPESPSTDASVSPDANGGTVSLPQGAFLTAYGDGEATFPSDQPGLAVGDFNDDGIDDFVAGSRFADPEGRQDAGAAYLVFGSSKLSGEVDFAAGDQDLAIFGDAPGDGIGYAAAAGDLNGDGADDLVLGAPFASTGPANGGAAHVFFGPLSSGEIDLASSEGDVTLTGDTGSLFGDSLATGDFNADGMADLLVGAPFAGGSGAVFAFFAGSDWTAEPALPDVTLFGAEQFDELGDYVLAADVNGDGADDIVATAEAADGPGDSRSTAGEVHVLTGGPDLAGQYLLDPDGSLLPPGRPNLSVYGAAENDTLGFALAAADLDSDGDDDLAMSARLATPPGGAGSEGIVYILPGGQGLPAQIDLSQPPPDVVAIAGTEPGGLFATSLAVLGSGPAALVLGGNVLDSESSDGGIVFVLPAAPPVSGAIDSLARVTFTGSNPGGHVGSNVASGDFNGDGRPDLAIIAELAPGPDASRPQAGRVYLVTP